MCARQFPMQYCNFRSEFIEKSRESYRVSSPKIPGIWEKGKY